MFCVLCWAHFLLARCDVLKIPRTTAYLWEPQMVHVECG
jgi:hypothetical protein